MDNPKFVNESFNGHSKLMIFLLLNKISPFLMHCNRNKYRCKDLLLFFFLLSSLVINRVSANKKMKDKFVVVLDAGHGGRDNGNRGNGYYEKKIALKITLGIGNRLKKNKDIHVIYTRDSDKFVELVNRAKIANQVDADLFISIHCDAHNSQAYGAGTFVLGLHANQRNFEIAKRENSVIFYEDNYMENYEGFDPNNPESVIGLTLMQETYLDQSILAASTIQKSFVNNLERKDRQVKQAGFVVLKYTYMPSVLIETGFLTNRKEGAYLNSRKGQEEMSSAIAEAIINYKNNLRNTYQEKKFFSNDNNKNLKSKVSPSKSYKKNVFFRVQISASKKSLSIKKYNFKGLEPIHKEKEGEIYRYSYGKTFDYQEAKRLKKKARRVGYRSAFIIAYKNNKRVPLNSVIK